MRYSRYFNSGQKIFLRALEPGPPPGRLEALSAYFQGQGRGYFNLALPYRSLPGENYPFVPGMPFEILTDALGLGVRLTATIHSQSGADHIRLEINNDLQVFQRRLFQRLDTQIGLRFIKGQGALRSFREQWEKNIRVLSESRDLSRLPVFTRCQVNLSAGGIRFGLKAPVEVADLCLLLLEIESNRPPICALAEVVWTVAEEIDDRIVAGLRFFSILESDQQRIDNFIQAAPGTPGSRKDQAADRA